MPITLGELAEQIGGALINGESSTEVSSVTTTTLQHASPGDISFLANRSYRKYLASTRAGVVILTPDDVAVCPVAAVVTDHPYHVSRQPAQFIQMPGLVQTVLSRRG